MGNRRAEHDREPDRTTNLSDESHSAAADTVAGVAKQVTETTNARVHREFRMLLDIAPINFPREIAGRLAADVSDLMEKARASGNIRGANQCARTLMSIQRANIALGVAQMQAGYGRILPYLDREVGDEADVVDGYAEPPAPVFPENPPDGVADETLEVLRQIGAIQHVVGVDPQPDRGGNGHTGNGHHGNGHSGNGNGKHD